MGGSPEAALGRAPWSSSWGGEEQSIQSRSQTTFHTPHKTNLVVAMPIKKKIKKNQCNKSKHSLSNVLLNTLPGALPVPILPQLQKEEKQITFFKNGDQFGFFLVSSCPEEHRYSSAP